MNLKAALGIPTLLSAGAALFTLAAEPLQSTATANAVDSGQALALNDPYASGVQPDFVTQFWPQVWGVSFTEGVSSMALGATATPGLYRVVADENPSMGGLYEESCQLSSRSVMGLMPHDVPGFNVEHVAVSCGRFRGPGGYDRSIFGLTVDYIAELVDGGETVYAVNKVFFPQGDADSIGEAMAFARTRFSLYNGEYQQVLGQLRSMAGSGGPNSWEECMDACNTAFDTGFSSISDAFDTCEAAHVEGLKNTLLGCAVVAAANALAGAICADLAIFAALRAQSRCDETALEALWQLYDDYLKCVDDCWDDFPGGPAPPSINDIPGLTYGNYRFGFGG